MGRGTSKAGRGIGESITREGGGSVTSKSNSGGSEADFIDRIARQMATSYSDEMPISNGDMQGMVEAYAAEKGLSLKDEDRITEAIRTRSQAYSNTENINGYTATAANGDKLEFYFAKNTDGETLYGNSINHIDRKTPNGWTEKQMIQRLKDNGGKATKYTRDQLVDKEVAWLEDRKATNEFLNNAYARNRDADIAHKAYRNSIKSSRIARRR